MPSRSKKHVVGFASVNKFCFITNTHVKYIVLSFSLCRLNELTCLSINMLYFPFWLINHNFLSPFTFPDNTRKILKISPLFSLLRHTHTHNNYIISLSLMFTLFLLFIMYKENIYKYKTLSLILYNTLILSHLYYTTR